MRPRPRKRDFDLGWKSFHIGDHQHQTPKLIVTLSAHENMPYLDMDFNGVTFSRIPMRLAVSFNLEEAKKFQEQLAKLVAYIEKERSPDGRYKDWL